MRAGQGGRFLFALHFRPGSVHNFAALEDFCLDIVDIGGPPWEAHCPLRFLTGDVERACSNLCAIVTEQK